MIRVADRPMVNAYELDDAGVEQLIYRPMTDDELATWQQGQQVEVAAALDASRVAGAKQVKALLETSDRYVRIAAETGQPMSAGQVGYRAQLRLALAAIAAAPDPTKVQLPSPPSD